jgi:hypothetical protein
LLTDTYPDADGSRSLILFEMATGRRIDIAQFFSPPELTGEIRCNLHSRWSRDATRVSIYSAHTGERQIYALDVSDIVGADARRLTVCHTSGVRACTHYASLHQAYRARMRQPLLRVMTDRLIFCSVTSGISMLEASTAMIYIPGVYI